MSASWGPDTTAWDEFVPNDLANNMSTASATDRASKRARRRRFVHALALALLAANLSACGSSLDFFSKKEEVPEEAADRLYNEGLYLLNVRHDPKEAAKKFEEVDRQHPYSDWARKALLMSAYA